MSPYDAGTPQPGIPTGQRAGPAAARDATEAQFYYPRLDDGASDHGAEGWYDVEADRDYLVGVTMADSVTSRSRARTPSATTSGSRAPRGRSSSVTHCWSRSVATTRSATRSAVGWSRWASSTSCTSTRTPTSSTTRDGARLTGASQLRRLAELPFVGTVTALGIRNADRVEVDGMRELGGRWATTRDVIERGGGTVVRDTVPRQTRCTSRSTSMCSTPRSRPGTRSRSPVGSAIASCARSWSKWRDAAASSASTWSSSTRRATRPAQRREWPPGSSRTFSARSSISRAERAVPIRATER